MSEEHGTNMASSELPTGWHSRQLPAKQSIDLKSKMSNYWNKSYYFKLILHWNISDILHSVLNHSSVEEELKRESGSSAVVPVHNCKGIFCVALMDEKTRRRRRRRLPWRLVEAATIMEYRVFEVKVIFYRLWSWGFLMRWKNKKLWCLL